MSATVCDVCGEIDAGTRSTMATCRRDGDHGGRQHGTPRIITEHDPDPILARFARGVKAMEGESDPRPHTVACLCNDCYERRGRTGPCYPNEKPRYEPGFHLHEKDGDIWCKASDGTDFQLTKRGAIKSAAEVTESGLLCGVCKRSVNIAWNGSSWADPAHAACLVAPMLAQVDEADDHAALVAYLLSAVRRKDWHAVSDAANDLRVMEAQRR